jgi:hypothetical protein
MTEIKETSPEPIKEYNKKSGLILYPCIIKLIVFNFNVSKKKYRTIEDQNEVH